MSGRHAERLKSSRFHCCESAASSRSVMPFFPALILSGILGCAAPLVVPIDAGGPIELTPNQALLIIHVDTDIALENLFLNYSSVAKSLGKGRHVWMTRVTEGHYRWRKIEIGKNPRDRSNYLLDPDEEFSFEVRAGKINYPGELMIRSGALSRWGKGDLIVRNRNHSAMAVRELRDSYDSIVRSFPLHYAGFSDDGFLEYYTRKREGSTAESSGEENPEGGVEAPAEAP